MEAVGWTKTTLSSGLFQLMSFMTLGAPWLVGHQNSNLLQPVTLAAHSKHVDGSILPCFVRGKDSKFGRDDALVWAISNDDLTSLDARGLSESNT